MSILNTGFKVYSIVLYCILYIAKKIKILPNEINK